MDYEVINAQKMECIKITFVIKFHTEEFHQLFSYTWHY